VDGNMGFSWYYRPDVHYLSTIELVAGDVLHALQSIAADCREMP